MTSKRTVIAVLLLASVPAMAQTGGVTGAVKDQSGAVLPGVTISIINTGTNAERTAITDERGDYTLTLLPIGVYRIQAELSGFKTGIAENIKVNANDRLRIDFTLEVGAVNEQLVVTESAPLVQSETSSVGKVTRRSVICSSGAERPCSSRSETTFTGTASDAPSGGRTRRAGRRR